jgi:hypothetical protein
MICADDSQIINPSEFASKVEPGMVLEMSIVLRQTNAHSYNEKKCPRCGHVNSNVTAYRG